MSQPFAPIRLKLPPAKVQPGVKRGRFFGWLTSFSVLGLVSIFLLMTLPWMGPEVRQWSLAPLLLPLYAAMVRLARKLVPGEIVVGVEGIRLRGFLHSQYVTYDQVISAARHRPSSIFSPGRDRSISLEILLADGRRWVIDVGDARSREAADAADANVARLAAAISERVASITERDLSFEASLRLPPGDLGEAVQRLRQRGRVGQVDHRNAPLDSDKVWGVLESSGASARTRVAAAVLLSARANEEERIRLRRLAESTADVRLGEALEQVAEIDAEEDAEAQHRATRALRRTKSDG